MRQLNQLFKRRVNTQLVDELLNKTQTEVDKMQPLNVLVAGKTGSGKSTLINALFRENLASTGAGLPITQQLVRITKEGVPLTLYDTKGLELTAESQREVLASLSDLLIEKRQGDPRDKIHVVYYCLNSTMARIEAMEIEIIKTLAQYVPVILVLTQQLDPGNQEFLNHLQAMALPVRGIVPILAKAYSLPKQALIPPHGLNELLSVHRAFINAQQVDLARKVKEARRWAQTYVTTAFGVGFMPIPVADATLLVPMQITMLAHLSAIFGVSLEKSQLISLVMGLGGTGGTTLMGKLLVSSIFKILPGLGTITGGAVTGAIASGLTLSLAYSYIEVLKQIATAERQGRDMRLREIQKIMNRSFEQHVAVVNQVLPDNLKQGTLVNWLQSFFEKF